MKKRTVVLLLLVFVVSFVFAGDYRPPVLVEAMEFEVEASGNILNFTWLSYQRSDFKWYKLVRSRTNREPVYPDDEYIFVGSDRDDTFFSYTHRESGTWYYRLTIVTTGRDRWVSPVFTFNGTSNPGAPPGPEDFN